MVNLRKNGQRISGIDSIKKPKKVMAPSISAIIKNNEYISEIFDKYPVNTYHKEVGLPAFV